MPKPYTLLAPYWTRLRTSRAATVAQRIAVVVVACSLAVMLIGLSTGRGLQAAISDKLTGLWGDIQVRPYAESKDPSEAGMVLGSNLLQLLTTNPSIASVRPTLSTTALVAHQDRLEALVYRTQSYASLDIDFLKGIPPGRNEVALPVALARQWNVGVGDELTLLFSRGTDRRPALRYATISGIFQPKLDELDGHWVYGDVHQLREWVGWADERYTALELTAVPGMDARDLAEELRPLLPAFWEAYPAVDDYAGLYQWLALFDTNLTVVVGVLLGVALFNSAVVVFILLLDQRKNIGILKTLGASASLLTRLFLAKAQKMALMGIAGGNALAFLFCFTQSRWHWLALDPKTYYVATVPIAWPWAEWIALNGLMYVLVLVSMTLPAWYLGKQKPIRSLQW
jgi:lipoprotein-releasing system permease protein